MLTDKEIFMNFKLDSIVNTVESLSSIVQSVESNSKVFKEDIEKFNDLTNHKLITNTSVENIKDTLKLHINNMEESREDLFNSIVKLKKVTDELFTEMLLIRTKDIVKDKFETMCEDFSNHIEDN